MPIPCARCGVIPADPSGLHACIPRQRWIDELNRIAYGIPLEDLMAQGTAASSPYDAMNWWRERAERAEAELHRLRVQTANLELQINRLTSVRANGVFSQDMLAKILSLVHPDKHANSEVSNEVTKYILSLRRK